MPAQYRSARSARALHVSMLLALLLLTTMGVASGATLMVEGPRGATVELDGAARGVLPLAAPLEVDAGQVRLRLLLPGHRVHDERILVPQEHSDVFVSVELRSLSRWNAVVASAGFAGLGQLYERRARMGWTMIGLQGAAYLTALWGEARFESSRDDYEAFDQQYREAIAPLEIARLRQQRDEAWDDLESAEGIRDAAIGAAVAIGLWSVLDAWLGFETVVVDAEVPAVGAAGPPPSGSGLRVGWRFGF